MDRHRPHDQAPPPQGLEHCPHCGRPFIVCVGLLDHVDEGLYLLALHCTDCDALALGIHEDAELERLERRDEAIAAAMAQAVADAEVARFIAELGGFTRALEEDLVLPEDF